MEERFSRTENRLELAVAIVIALVITLVAVRVILTGFEVRSFLRSRAAASREARDAVEQVWHDSVSGHNVQIDNARVTVQTLSGAIVYATRKEDGANAFLRNNDVIAPDVVHATFSCFDEKGVIVPSSVDCQHLGFDIEVEAMGEAGVVHMRMGLVPRAAMYSSFQ